MTIEGKIDILYDIIVKKEKYEDVAKRYCRTAGHKSNMVKKLK